MQHVKAIVISGLTAAVVLAILFRIQATKKLIAPTLP